MQKEQKFQEIQEIAKRIKKTCEEKGISLNKLLSDCDAGTRTYHNMKAGSSPSIDKIIKIADYLEIPVDYLLGRDEKKMVQEKQSKEFDYDDYLIGYIDILGTRNLFENRKDKAKVTENYKIMYDSFFKVIDDMNFIPNENNTINEKYLFKYNIFSDNIIIAVKYDTNKKEQLFSELALFLANLQNEIMLKLNLFSRGVITRGNLYMSSNFVLGEGLIDAYENESTEIKYPCIAVPHELYTVRTIPTLVTKQFVHKKSLNDKYVFLDTCYMMMQFKDISSNIEYINTLCDILKNNISSIHNDLSAVKKCKWFYNYLSNYANEQGIILEHIDFEQKEKEVKSQCIKNGKSTEMYKLLSKASQAEVDELIKTLAINELSDTNADEDVKLVADSTQVSTDIDNISPDIT